MPVTNCDSHVAQKWQSGEGGAQGRFVNSGKNDKKNCTSIYSDVCTTISNLLSGKIGGGKHKSAKSTFFPSFKLQLFGAGGRETEPLRVTAAITLLFLLVLIIYAAHR